MLNSTEIVIKNSYSPYTAIQSANSRNYLFLFLLWPFLAFITALMNYDQRESKRVVYFFLIYYGLTFVNNNEMVDAYRYALNFQRNNVLPFSDFFKIVGGLYGDTTIDIVEPLISFIVSRFTVHTCIYFAVWASIFGFFYLKSINLVYERYRTNPNWNSLIMMVFFISIMPITYLSGIRMWTAAWIFFYSAYHVVVNRNIKFAILALSASLLHWSFLTANAILLIYIIAGNRNIIYMPITLISFAFPHLLGPLFRNLSDRMGGIILSRYEGYSSEGYLIAQQTSFEQASWFLKIGSDLLMYYLIFAIIIIQLNSKSYVKENQEKNLYSFILLFLAFVNFGKSIPSFGGRFQILFYLFASVYIFSIVSKIRDKRINLMTILGLFPMALYTAITFRMGSESISVWLFSPGFGLPLLIPAQSLAEFFF